MEGEPQKERAGDKNQPVLAKIRALLESTENIKGGVATTRVGEGLEIEQKIRVKRKTENEETTEEFEIKKVKDEEKLKEIHTFLVDHFGKEKMISYETLKNDFEGHNRANEPRAKYDIYYVENEEGEIVAARISENLDLIDENNNETNETIFYAIYIAVDKEAKYKGIGLPEQLYASALLDSIKKAINKKIICILAESGKEAEKMMRRMGFGSFYYIEEGGDATYTEFEFNQPALEFDKNGQKTIADGEEPREHFSVFPFDENQNFAIKYFEKIYRTLILKEYEIEHPQREFRDNEAYQQLLNYFNQLMEETLSQINDKELVFITPQQKEEMQKNGANFQDLKL